MPHEQKINSQNVNDELKKTNKQTTMLKQTNKDEIKIKTNKNNEDDNN